jgi:hypothetical protein
MLEAKWGWRILNRNNFEKFNNYEANILGRSLLEAGVRELKGLKYLKKIVRSVLSFIQFSLLIIQ